MIALKITAEEQRILLDPTAVEKWGAQQEVARKVQRQVILLSGTVEIDDIDIFCINATIAANREGSRIEGGRSRAGGWNAKSWPISASILRQAVKPE